MRIVAEILTISPNRIRRSSRMAVGAALPKSRIVSAFKFPPSLSTKHEEELRKRAISKEFALASGIRTAADNELRELNFQASLPCEERSKGLQGICFPYVDLELNAEAAWRIKPDTTFTMSDGSHPKYLSRLGDKPRAFFPHTTTLEMLSDPKVNIVLTEGEYKALAIAEALQKAEHKRKFTGIGLQKVNRISTMSQTKCNLEGFWFFQPVSASTFSAQTGRTRKVQWTERDTGGQLSAENGKTKIVH